MKGTQPQHAGCSGQVTAVRDYVVASLSAGMPYHAQPVGEESFSQNILQPTVHLQQHGQRVLSRSSTEPFGLKPSMETEVHILTGA